MEISEGTKKEINTPLKEIKFTCERSIQLWLNDTLSYLTIEEAIKLKRELDESIKDHIFNYDKQ